MQDSLRNHSWPLTAAQAGIWLGQQLDQASPLYNAAEYLEFRFAVDEAALEAAIQRCMEEAEALRVRFAGGEGGPRQWLSAVAATSVLRIDFSHAEDPQAQAQSFMQADARTLLDLRTGPLFRHALLRLGNAHTLWYFAAHHVALDGFGFALVQKRVSELYSAQVAGKPVPGSTFGSLAAVVAEDEAYQASPERTRDRAFFEAQLANFAEPVSFTERQSLSSSTSIRCSAELSLEVKQALDAFARAARVSWVDGVIAAFAAYLGRVSGAREVVLGLPVMGRMGSSALRVPSMVMNIVPLCLGVAPEESFASLVCQVRNQVRALMPHSRYRYEHLRRDLMRVGGNKRLFGPVVNVMPFDHGFRFAGQYVATHNITAGPVEDLAVGVYAHADGRGPKIAFDANPACYSESEIQTKLDEFIAFISEAALRPQAALAVLGRPEGDRAYTGGALLSGPELAGGGLDVVERIRRQALENPARIAVEQGTRTLSYQQLVTAAERAAQQLAGLGLGPESLVAIAMPRSLEAVTAMLGVLMAGAAYLPLDLGGPEGRTLAILQDAKPACLLALGQVAEAISQQVRVVLWAELQPQREPELEAVLAPSPAPGLPHVSAASLAYVIYTSGSTGKPNGVMIERGALAHFAASASQRYGFAASDRVLQFAPLHFDASVEELFVTLCVGATLVLRSDEMVESVPRFLSLCEALQISVLDLPTAFWHEVAYHLDAAGAVFPERVRIVIIGGEAALAEHARRFLARVGPHVALVNTYGPTEATVVATSAVLTAASLAEIAPIGVPLPGVSARLMAPSGLPVAPGEVGELYLSGPGLARGYLGRPVLSARRFVTLHAVEAAPRAYRTGDLARISPEGQLVFVGRVDDELKISGHRVDPLEIENVLSAHPGVLECAVVAQGAATGGKSLVAHLVVSEPAPDLESLRAHARRALSGPAVPSVFVFRARLPRSSSGKIDRASLRDTEVTLVRAAAHALNPLEQALCEIWQEVLGQADLSPDDDFFERGGQSLQTIQVVNRLSAHLGREVPAALLFRHPTISGLSRALSGEAADRGAEDALFVGDAELAADIFPAPGAHAKVDWTQVLLSGATGFVGAHLLNELLTHTEARVVCLVRAKDAADGKLRLQKAFAAQGLSMSAFETRVEVLPADLSAARLGLSDADYMRLSEACDTVFHCGASVSLVRGYASLRGANVLGTQELLRFAVQGQLKTFHHVSTVAAASGAAGDVPEAFVATEPALRDGYAQSKWLAESLVAQAIERGVSATVYRLGRVVGPRSTGFVNPQDIVWRLLRVGIRAGVVPNLPVSEPWTEVDRVARAIVKLAQEAAPAQVYNLTPASQVSLPSVFAWVSEYGYALRNCALPEFRAQVGQGQDAGDAATLSFFDAHASEGAPETPRVQGVATHCTEARLALLELNFPSVDRALVHRYLDFCVSSGFLPPPPSTTCATGE